MDPFAQQDLEEQKKLENIAKSFESRYVSIMVILVVLLKGEL
jgi:hypothetical protein